MSDEMKHHILVYRNVFIGLLICTALTVGASYIEFSLVWIGVTVGLSIAFIKGYLVAANFMHLNNEKPLIYLTLTLTVMFFLVLFFMPTMWHVNILTSPPDIPIQTGEVYKEVDLHKHSNHHDDGH
jgi:caa(3)-type oxidase subunit IV